MPSVNLNRLVSDSNSAISATGGKTPPISFAIVAKDDIRTTIDERQGGAVANEIEGHIFVGTVGTHSTEVVIGDTLEAVSTNTDHKARWVRGRIRSVAELHEKMMLQTVQVQDGCTIKVLRPVRAHILRGHEELVMVLSGDEGACPLGAVVVGQLGGCEVLNRGKSVE